MKKLTQIVVVIAAAVFAFSCSTSKKIATAKQTYNGLEDSVLWKIEHESLEEPSYIMGTFHLMCKSDDMIADKVKAALSEVDELVLEIDFDDPKELMAMQTELLKSTPISEELTAEEYEALSTKVDEYIGIPLRMIDPMGLFGLYSLMSVKFLDCGAPPTGLELELVALAEANNQEVEGLETVEEQLSFMKHAITKEDVLKLFDDFDQQKTNFTKALTLYKNEQIDEVMDVLSDGQEMTQEQLDNMLIIRNNNWLEKIPAMIAEDSALIAVGAGHLLEEYGIIHQLRLKGYTITPVY